MKCKIAICDDNPADQAYIAELLRRWGEARHAAPELRMFRSAEQFLFQYAEEKDFHILILDIEMEQMNGVELAKTLRREDRALQILFVTGYPDYSLEGYEVGALHYLLKPVKEDVLFRVMDRAVSGLEVREKVLLVHSGGEMRKIPVKDIFFVEVFSHACVIRTGDENIETQMPIRELETRLGEDFVRVHRSYLVNLERIRKIGKSEVSLENGSVVPLSRRKYRDVNLAFIRHFGDRAVYHEADGLPIRETD